MARTQRYPAWIWKAEDFKGDSNYWWKRHWEKRHGMPVELLITKMNHKGTADGIDRNAPKWFRQQLNQKFRAKQNHALRNAIAQSQDMDALTIEPRQRRNANWIWF